MSQKRTTANDLDATIEESLKNTNEANNEIEVIDNKTQGIRATLEGVSNRARNVDNEQGPEPRVLMVRKIICNRSPTLLLLLSDSSLSVYLH